MNKTILLQINKLNKYFIVEAPDFLKEKIGNSSTTLFYKSELNPATLPNKNNWIFTVKFNTSDIPKTDIDITTKTIKIEGKLDSLKTNSLQLIFEKLIMQFLPFAGQFALDLSIIQIKDELVGVYFADKDSLFFEKEKAWQSLSSIVNFDKPQFDFTVFDKNLNLANGNRDKINKMIVLNCFSVTPTIKALKKRKAKYVVSSYIVSCPLLKPIVVPEWGFLFNPLIEHQHEIVRYNLISKIADLPVVKVYTNFEKITKSILQACRI